MAWIDVNVHPKQPWNQFRSVLSID